MASSSRNSSRITAMTVKVVERDTAVSFKEVIVRLDSAVNKAGSDNIIPQLRGATSQEEFEAVVNRSIGSDFLYFNELPAHKMLRFSSTGDATAQPAVVVYTIGNPLIAQAILRHNPLAAYSIPPRLLVLEKPHGAGSVVYYHLPSSLMGIREGRSPPGLEKELQLLDAKVERLVTIITADVDTQINATL